MLVDISNLNHMPVHAEWYDYTLRTNGFPTNTEIDQFLDGLDTVIMCETALNYYLIERANQLGVRTILQANAEFFDWFNRPSLPRPSVIGLPTRWMAKEVAQAVKGTEVIDLPVPIDLDELPRRTVTQARRFFHVAGRPAIHDRNGTLEFIMACKQARNLTRTGVMFFLYCQQPTPEIKRALIGAPINLIGHVDNPADMYRDGDVLILPRKYGGLCLSAQEAIGSGIPVIMPAIEPNTSWLPRQWLLRPLPKRSFFMARSTIEVRSVAPAIIAKRMVQLARDDAEVAAMGQQAVQIAERMSWEALLPLYEKVLAPEAVA